MSHIRLSQQVKRLLSLNLHSKIPIQYLRNLRIFQVLRRKCYTRKALSFHIPVILNGTLKRNGEKLAQFFISKRGKKKNLSERHLLASARESSSDWGGRAAAGAEFLSIDLNEAMRSASTLPKLPKVRGLAVLLEARRSMPNETAISMDHDPPRNFFDAARRRRTTRSDSSVREHRTDRQGRIEFRETETLDSKTILWRVTPNRSTAFSMEATALE